MFFFANISIWFYYVFSYDHIINRHGIAGAVQQKTVVVHCDFHQLGPTGPSWSKSCHVRLWLCVRHRVQFFSRPLIGPQVT